jgi:hypothetical protein
MKGEEHVPIRYAALPAAQRFVQVHLQGNSPMRFADKTRGVPVSRRLTSRLRAACGILLFSAYASAGPVTWYLQNVQFGDGGIATGSFVYDADLGAHGTYGAVDIVTSGGSLTSTTYLFADARYTGPGQLDAPASGSPTIGTLYLLLDFVDHLTDAGGTVQVFFVSEGPCFAYTDCHELSNAVGIGRYNYTNAGQVVSEATTPEPVSWLLAAAGLAACLVRLRMRGERSRWRHGEFNDCFRLSRGNFGGESRYD